MNISLFFEFVDKYFRQIVGKITEKLNPAENTMLHKSMLTEEYSADLNWGATELNGSIVAADVVALDSSLPLKRRGTIALATGKLPKIGIKYRKGEKLISDINVMIARGADEATIASKIFDDTGKVIKAIDVRKEILFQQALSTGVVLTTDMDNRGTGIRADFGYKAENTFHAKYGWGDKTSTPEPMTDLQKMFDKALTDGNTIGHVYMSRKYFDLFRNSVQGKTLVAVYNQQVVTNPSLLPPPSRTVFLNALKDEFNAEFHVIDASYRVEDINGELKNIQPWEQANVVATPTDVVGRLVYGTLAEETNPVEGVNYEKSGSHILVSKYSKNDPLEEFTAGQALCIPVIDGAEGIYVLHADATAELTADPTLEFPKSKSTKTVELHYDGQGTLSVSSDEEWLTATIAGNKVNAAADANSGAKRTATLTVTDGTLSVTIEVTQAAGA